MNDIQIYILLREEVSVRTAVLQGHAVASGAHAVPCYSQRAVVVCQSSVLHHRHVPQEGVRLSLRLDGSTKVPTTRTRKTYTQDKSMNDVFKSKIAFHR